VHLVGFIVRIYVTVIYNKHARRLTEMCKKTNHTKLQVQMVFLMIDMRCSKHVEDTKNWIKTLIWKVYILLGYVL